MSTDSVPSMALSLASGSGLGSSMGGASTDAQGIRTNSVMGCLCIGLSGQVIVAGQVLNTWFSPPRLASPRLMPFRGIVWPRCHGGLLLFSSGATLGTPMCSAGDEDDLSCVTLITAIGAVCLRWVNNEKSTWRDSEAAGSSPQLPRGNASASAAPRLASVDHVSVLAGSRLATAFPPATPEGFATVVEPKPAWRANPLCWPTSAGWTLQLLPCSPFALPRSRSQPPRHCQMAPWQRRAQLLAHIRPWAPHAPQNST